MENKRVWNVKKKKQYGVFKSKKKKKSNEKKKNNKSLIINIFPPNKFRKRKSIATRCKQTQC